MNQLLHTKQEFLSGKIDKGDFIKEMYRLHRHLFDYPEALADTNISGFRIGKDGVVAEFKDPSILMLCQPGDMRMAPVEAFNFGDYEPDEIQTVRRIIEEIGGKDAKFFDIGANAGFYSLALSAYFPGIEGIAFEPIPTTYTTLLRNLEINGISSVEALNLGLGEKEGELIFYTYPSQSGSSSMTRNVDSADTLEIKCRVAVLDNFCDSEKAKADFIKCDVEGAELFVFKGAAKMIARDKPVVFTEMLRKWCAKYEYHPNDIIVFFKELGYSCYVMSGRTIKECNEVTEATLETNYLLMHLDKHQALISTLT